MTTLPASRHWSTAALIALTAALVGACSLITDLGDRPGADRLVRGGVPRPAWASEGQAIYYTDRAGSQVTTFTLNVVEAGSGSSRRITSVSGWNTGGEQVRTVADPATVFFSISDTSRSGYAIYEAPSSGGQADLLATNSGTPWFFAARNGNRLAYPGPGTSSDTIFVLSRTGAGEFAQTAIHVPVDDPIILGVSPDGESIVFSAPGVVYMVPADGGESQLLWTGPESRAPDSTKTFAAQVRWNGASPTLLMSAWDVSGSTRELHIRELDLISGHSILRASLPDAIHGPIKLAWSEDGRYMAAWVPVSIHRQNVERTTYRQRMYVDTPRTDGMTRLFEWTADQPLSWLEFSADSSWLGFVFRGDLYVARH